MANSVQYFAN